MNCNNAISQSKDNILIKIHVIPGSTQSLFPAGYNNWRECIEVKVKAAAKENKANNEIIEIIAEFFKLPVKNIHIVSGEKGREKTVSIQDIKKSDVCGKIEGSLDGL